MAGNTARDGYKKMGRNIGRKVALLVVAVGVFSALAIMFLLY